MQKLLRDLIDSKLSRRGFVAAMVSAGYSAAAAKSALQSAAPFVQGAETAPSLTRIVTGTGGELLAEQVIETGARYMFVANASGVGPLCDALVTRPQLQLIQAVQEGQAVSVADGYARASGKPGFVMFSRVGRRRKCHSRQTDSVTKKVNPRSSVGMAFAMKLGSNASRKAASHPALSP